MTTETGAEVGTLTKQDIRAMREADRVSFHRHAGRDTIRCTKEVKKSGPFEDRERDYEIAVRAHVRVFRGDGGEGAKDAACFAMVYNWTHTESVWGTVAYLLKPGGVVSLEWVGSDNNGYLKNMQGEKLHHDNLYLNVRRGGRRLKFWVDDSICPDNTARMVKPRG